MNDKQLVLPVMYFPETNENYASIYYSNHQMAILVGNDNEVANVYYWKVKDKQIWYSRYHNDFHGWHIDDKEVHIAYQQHLLSLICGEM